MNATSRQMIAPVVRSPKFDGALSALLSGRTAGVLSLEDEFGHWSKRMSTSLAYLINDLPDGPQFWDDRMTRIRMLRRITVMPSRVIKAIADYGRCSAKHPRPSLAGASLRCIGAKVARDFGIDINIVFQCWRAKCDLDAQWHALRRVLLEGRSSSEVNP